MQFYNLPAFKMTLFLLGHTLFGELNNVVYCITALFEEYYSILYLPLAEAETILKYCVWIFSPLFSLHLSEEL